MRVISRRTIKNYWESVDNANRSALENALKAWYREVKDASWINANQIKDKYRSASILKDGRVVFNICGNKYRIVVKVKYPSQIVYIRWVGTHHEYDSIRAEEV